MRRPTFTMPRLRRCRKTDQYVAIGIAVFVLLTFVMYQVNMDPYAKPSMRNTRRRLPDGSYDKDTQDRSEVVHSKIRILKTSYGTVEVRDIVLRNSREQLTGKSNLSSKSLSLLSSFDSRERGRYKAAKRQKMSDIVKELQAKQRAGDSRAKVEVSREKAYSCKTRLCAELPNKDRPYFKYCFMKAKLRTETQLSKCHFMNTSARQHPTALASYSGTDTSYIRGLLQAVTGFCTGAIYCSDQLRVAGFPGESIRSGAVLVVNTDQTEPRWSNVIYSDSEPLHGFKKVQDIPLFGSAVLLVQNPLHSLLAEWRRRHSDNANSDMQWSSFVEMEAGKWKRTVLSWLTENRDHSVLVVKYEQLLTHTASELQRVLEFLEVPYSAQSLAKVGEVDYEVFGSEHENFAAADVEVEFSSEQVAFVKKVVTETIDTLKGNGLAEECDLLEYL